MPLRPFLIGVSLFLALLLASFPRASRAEDPAIFKILERLDRLEKKQAVMEKQLKEKDERIQQLEAELKRAKEGTPQTQVTTKPEVEAPTAEIGAANPSPTEAGNAAGSTSATESPLAQPESLGAAKTTMKAVYEPGKGFRVFTSKWGEMNIAIYSYARYLNQHATNSFYTDSFGRTFAIDQRNDIQLAKLQIKFAGWLGTPKLRYYLWAWTSNANMGQGAQVVLGGTLTYLLNPHFNFGAGIAALPTTRSTLGTFPYWLRVDARPIADEFFRGSYTTGVWMFGDILKNLHYKTMAGNNLSQLGIDASQLDNAFRTYSTALWYTTDNVDAYAGVGDFEEHEKPGLIFGGAYTYSREDKQSQPNKEGFENTQIRLSDGTAIFDPNAFGPGLQVEKATYQMTSLNGSVKYRGFSFDYNYYLRWINSLSSPQILPFKNFFDHGFDLQASYMIVPKMLQIYSFGSKIFGEFGKPWELGGGFNVFPLKNKATRFNIELDYVHHSPVGYLAYPTQVGSNGPIFMANFELNL